jgi:hypothetical protein
VQLPRRLPRCPTNHLSRFKAAWLANCGYAGKSKVQSVSDKVQSPSGNVQSVPVQVAILAGRVAITVGGGELLLNLALMAPRGCHGVA